MKTILCFGNPLIEEDNLALKIGRGLSDEYNVVFVVDVDEILQYNLEEVYILDVAENVDDIKMFKDIDAINAGRICSLHDFDLGFFLKLLKELGRIESIRIICVPKTAFVDQATKKVVKLIG